MIPYGHQSISEDDIKTVVGVLRSDWLTQGPKVEEFERALADYCGAKYAVVVSSGTAALHAAFAAAGVGLGDEFITTPMTFPATANAGIWQGARPIFVDIKPDTGNLDPTLIEQSITEKTKAIVPVDYTGRPADLDEIKVLAKDHNLAVIEDACQALGASYHGRKIGSVSDLTTFSFHPVKSITTGEGGAILTDDPGYYQKLKRFITHGVSKEAFIRPAPGDWYFEMQILGLNYRLTDIQAALGLSQLKRLDDFVAKRRRLAERYMKPFQGMGSLIPLAADTDVARSAWHLYVLRLAEDVKPRRAEIFAQLRAAGIGVNVHHIPVYLHPYYEQIGYRRGLCPKAEAWYDSIISLPLYSDLTDSQQDYVIEQVLAAVK